MSEVWRHSAHKGSALLLLLAIADSADDENRSAWPSLRALAKKTRIGRRQVIRLIQDLSESKEIAVQRRRTAGDNLSSIYTIRPYRGGDKMSLGGGPQDTILVSPMSPKYFVSRDVNETSTKRLLENAIKGLAEQKTMPK